MGQSPVTNRALPIFLGLACVIPTGFGIMRSLDLIRTNDWPLRFAAEQVDHLPLLLHIVGAVIFLVFGAVQLVPGLRRRFPRWHQKAGRWVAPAGLVGALSGLWMTLAHGAISTDVLFWGRIASSTAWTLFILLSLQQLAKRDFKAHGRWMIRAYALALPAGTLAFFLFPLVLIMGEENIGLLGDVVQVAAWPLHLAVAEYLLRRKPKASATPALPIMPREA